MTDEETHLGAADLALTTEDLSKASGTYWTRRSWRTGHDTAGTLELSRLEPRKEKDRSLRGYAAAHKAQITDWVNWCGWSDSNRHSLRKGCLRPSRLPFRHTRTRRSPAVASGTGTLSKPLRRRAQSGAYGLFRAQGRIG